MVKTNHWNDVKEKYVKLGIINFPKHFLNFVDATIIWYLNSKLDLNLSCANEFNADLVCKLKKIVGSHMFSAQFI